MKKIILFSVIILTLVCAFVGCSKDNSDETTTESTYPWENDNWQQTEASSDNYNDSTLNQNSQNENPSVNNNSNNNFTGNDYNNQSNISNNTNNGNNNQNNNTQNNNSSSSGNSNPLISDEDMSKLENSNAEVYFTDNPNNPSIVTISQRYGVPKENLVALIKVNAEFPTVTILEFSGARDANGELVMTYEEFQNIYEINETNGSIVKASKNGTNNDGLSFIEAKIYVTLAKEYFIPELPNLKANKRYPE